MGHELVGNADAPDPWTELVRLAQLQHGGAEAAHQGVFLDGDHGLGPADVLGEQVLVQWLDEPRVDHGAPKPFLREPAGGLECGVDMGAHGHEQ